MQLEDYFHSIQQEKPMVHKDTRVTFSIDQDNSDLEDFADKYISQTNSYSGPSWMQILEDVIKVLEVHYEYDIKSQVYYAVKHPIFDHNYSPAPGRELHQKTLNDLLKKYPEINNGGEHEPITW